MPLGLHGSTVSFPGRPLSLPSLELLCGSLEPTLPPAFLPTPDMLFPRCKELLNAFVGLLRAQRSYRSGGVRWGFSSLEVTFLRSYRGVCFPHTRTPVPSFEYIVCIAPPSRYGCIVGAHLLRSLPRDTLVFQIAEPEACDQMYESLARLHSNYYKHKVSGCRPLYPSLQGEGQAEWGRPGYTASVKNCGCHFEM